MHNLVLEDMYVQPSPSLLSLAAVSVRDGRMTRLRPVRGFGDCVGAAALARDDCVGPNEGLPCQGCSCSR